MLKEFLNNLNEIREVRGFKERILLMTQLLTYPTP